MALVTKGNEEGSMADDEKPEGNRRPADEGPDREDREERDERPESKAPPAHEGGGFLSIYKPGQGYWTRMATAGALLLLLLYTGQFLFTTMRFQVGLETRWAALVVGVIALAVVVVAWKYMNRPDIVDFFIATESEMKKVNWTSRKDLMGSTKVVILFMLLIAFFLFIIDVVFGYFFYLINVLKHGPFA